MKLRIIPCYTDRPWPAKLILGDPDGDYVELLVESASNLLMRSQTASVFTPQPTPEQVADSLLRVAREQAAILAQLPGVF